MLSGTRPSLAVLATLLAAGSLPAQADANGARKLVTPDGSTFLLVPQAGRPVAYWASFVHMGRVHEGPGQEGLAEACARASLCGTRRHGTSQPDEELAALDALDVALRRLADAGADPDARTEPAAAVDAARARCRELGDPRAFLRVIAALPATIPTVTTTVDGTLLTAALPSARLGDFALLMEARRHDATMRDFDRVLAEVRERLAAEAASPGAAHRRTACLLAMDVHPRRLALRPPASPSRFVSRQEALTFYRERQRPEHTVTVIVGSFSPESLERRLQSVFVQRREEPMPPAPPSEPPQRGRRLRDVAAAGDPRLVLAWRIPPGTGNDALAVLGELIAGPHESLLRRPLIDEQQLAQTIVVSPRFPGDGDPALFLVEITASPGADFAALTTATATVVDRLRGGVDAAVLRRAATTWAAATRRHIEDPFALATRLARQLARGESASIEVVAPSAEEVQALIVRLLVPAGLSEVRSKTEKEGDAK